MTGNNKELRIKGAAYVAEGSETLRKAVKTENGGRASLAVAARGITHGVDERVVADRMAKLSDIVAAAGVTDITEGLALLDESEDVDLMSVMVGLMGAADLERGLEIARIAGELRAISDIMDLLKLPVLSVFLQSRSEELRLTAVDVMLKSVGARALSAALSDEAKRVAGMGAEEAAERFARLAMSAGLAAGSAELAEVAEGAA